MQLDIITADKTLFSGNAEVVTLPGTDGQFQILNNHAALISSLKQGVVDVKSAELGNQAFDINGGVVEVLQNKVVVLA
jgi:F-type H+-transporting ATPase subunit epsilon